MPRFLTGLTGVLTLLVLVLSLAACGQAGVEDLRRNYTAELNGWYTQETPAAAEAMITVGDDGAGDDGAGEGVAEEGAETPGEEGEEEIPSEMPETVTVTQKVTLDIMLRHEGGGTLPRVTVDIYQADAEENQKQNWKLPVDTSDLAVTKQFTQTLEGVDLEEGDVFAVEVREHVPPEEQDEYPEFAQQSSS